MTQKPILFILLTLIPVPLLLLAVIQSGYWSLWVIIYMTAFAVFCDKLIKFDFKNKPDDHLAKTVLPIALGSAHFILLPLAVYSLSYAPFSIAEKLALFFAFGLFLGTISHANAHELIHRTNRTHHLLGKWIFISMLFGHHTSAHLLVHHPYVGTNKDPNTARFNESFYSFAKRACYAEFIEGLHAENARLKKHNKPAYTLQNPYWLYCFGGAVAILFAYIFAGLTGVVIYFCLCAFAQYQMLMIDYVQHYGLERRLLDTGKYEVISNQHSWNAPHWFTSHLTLNAPRHSDHHTSPTKPYTELSHFPDDAPQLPYSVPFMTVLALWPKKWRAIMNPRVIAWRTR